MSQRPWTVTIPDDGDAIVWAETAEEAAAQVGTGLGLKLTARPADPADVAYSVVNGDGLERALADVITEREKQRIRWGDAHDDEHDAGELASAAAYLADPVTENLDGDADDDDLGWVVQLRAKIADDRRKQLVIAAALLLAEIERMDRAGAS